MHAVYRDGIAADGIDYALCIRTAENGLCHRSLPDGQMIRLTFLQAVLDGVAAFIAHGIAAVSYTHLDVYKRQVLGCRGGEARPAQLQERGRCIPALR